MSGEVVVTVLYRMIWFEETEDRLRTSLSVELELVAGDGREIWRQRKSFGLEMTDDTIPKSKTFQMTIPFELSSDLDTLRSGGNKIYITLTNRADGSMGRKVMDFKL